MSAFSGALPEWAQTIGLCTGVAVAAGSFILLVAHAFREAQQKAGLSTRKLLGLVSLALVAGISLGAAGMYWGQARQPKSLSDALDQVVSDLSGKKAESGSITHLLRVENRHFRNESVRIDGRQFINCKFENVTFLYDGGAYSMINASFVIGAGNEIRVVSVKRDINNFMKFWNMLQGDKFKPLEVPKDTITGDAPFP